MLCDALFSSYQQYKKDSDFIANWLATTARRTGYVVTQSEAAASQASRLNGRARTLARRAKKTSGQKRVYSVRISEFVPLAQHIAESKPRIEIPQVFVYVLRQAIRERRRHQDAYGAQHAASDQHGHLYFIDILESVQEILRPNFAAHIIQNDTMCKKQSVNNERRNTFQSLPVEEPASGASDYTMEESPRKEVNLEFTSDLGTSKGEAFLAAACLLSDLHAIRTMISSLWASFSDGKMDLISVSLTTNTAIDFVRHLQEVYDTTFAERLELNQLRCPVCVLKQHTACNNFPDICTSLPRKVLLALLCDLKTDSSDYVPCVVSGYMDLYDQAAVRQSMTPTQQARQAHELSMGYIPEVLMLMKRCYHVQAEHEIMRGLRQLTLRKELPFWLSFGVQIYLDIRHTLREKVTSGFAILCHRANNLRFDIERILALHDVDKANQSLKNVTQSLKEVLDLINRYTLQDFVDGIRRDLQQNPTESDRYPAHYLLKRDPIWCGLLLYNFSMVAHEGAILIANSSASIQATAHLYNSLQCSGHSMHRWLDLDTMLSVQGSESVFVGRRPGQLSECPKQFALACGTSITSLRSTRSNAPFRILEHKRKRLKPLIQILWTFKHRYCDSSNRVDWTPSDIETILLTVARAPTDSATGKTRRKLSVNQLLTDLASVLHHEVITELAFGYFEMHALCWGLLQRLNNDLGPRMIDWSETTLKEKYLPTLVFFIQLEAVEAKRNGSAAQSILVHDAGEIFNEMLNVEGGLITEKMDHFETEKYN